MTNHVEDLSKSTIPMAPIPPTESTIGKPEVPTTIDGVVTFVADYLKKCPRLKFEIKDGVIEIGDPERSFYTVSAVRKGGGSIPFEWGPTVEGDTPEQDFVEAHLVVAYGDEFGIRVVQQEKKDDLSARAVYEKKGGVKKAVAEKSDPNETDGIAGEKTGQVTIYRFDKYRGVSTFKATLATKEVDGKVEIYEPEELEQVIHGGVYVCIIPGEIEKEEPLFRFKPIIPYISPAPAGYGRKDFSGDLGLETTRGGGAKSYDIPPATLGMGVEMKGTAAEPKRSMAADLSEGDKIGESTRVSFKPDLEKAIGFVVRVRIDADQEPPPYSPQWVAWKNREHPPREKYTAISCTYCGSQVDSTVASMTDKKELQVHKNCPHCAGNNFHQVVYSRRVVEK